MLRHLVSVLIVAALLGLACSGRAAEPAASAVSNPYRDFFPDEKGAAAKAPVKCRKGDYLGRPVEGSSYTKESFSWAVSSSFAFDYCMPDEFVVNDLNSEILAIAYKTSIDFDEQICVREQGEEKCRTRWSHRLEIYYKSGAFPTKSTARSQRALRFPSRKMFSEKLNSATARPNRFSGMVQDQVFNLGQFELLIVNGGEIKALVGSMRADTYFKEIFDGVDYISLEIGYGILYLRKSSLGPESRLMMGVRSAGFDDSARRLRSFEEIEKDYLLMVPLSERIGNLMISAELSK